MGAENSRCKKFYLNSQENYSLILIIILKSIIKILLNSISVLFFLISVQTFQEIFGAQNTQCGGCHWLISKRTEQIFHLLFQFLINFCQKLKIIQSLFFLFSLFPHSERSLKSAFSWFPILWVTLSRPLNNRAGGDAGARMSPISPSEVGPGFLSAEVNEVI